MEPQTEREKVIELQGTFAAMKSSRYNYDNLWDRCARMALPSSANFTTKMTPGTDLHNNLFNSTAQLALPRFAAAIDTLITPQTSAWHKLQPRDLRAKRDYETGVYLDGLNELLFRARYRPHANFAFRAHEAYLSMGAFGTGAIYIHDAKPGIQYLSVHLSEIWFDQNAMGVIDTAFWEHEYAIRQLLQRWPDVEAKLPKDIVEKARKDPGANKIRVCMIVRPRDDYNPRRADNRNMKFACQIITTGDGVDPILLEESGFRTFPFAVARYLTGPRDLYGIGPTQMALAEILTLQEMRKTLLRAGQLAVDPSYLAMDEESLAPFSMRPGAMNYGYLMPDGTPRVQTLQIKSPPIDPQALTEECNRAINGAYLINLFQVLEQNPADRRTATEVTQLVQEKGALLAPIGGRLRVEFLGNIIDREIDILAHSGVIRADDVPRALRDAGGDYNIEFDSPLTQAMMADRGIAALRTVEIAGALAQFDQTIPGTVNARHILRTYNRVNGGETQNIYSDDEIDAKAEEQSQAAAAMQAAQMAPDLANTAKTLVEANNMAGAGSRVI